MHRSRVSMTTRELLILVAERLFATNGIGGVSLREIGIEAGQRNTSVTHYYFGSKKALVRAVFEYRMEPVNAQRHRMLDAMRQTRREHDLRALLEALVLPTADGVVEDGHFGRFLAHLHTDPTYRVSDDWDAASGARELCDRITGVLDYLPPEVLLNRLRMLRGLVYVTAGEMEQRGATATEGRTQPWALDLVDAAMGLLTAPTRRARTTNHGHSPDSGAGDRA